ncbi:UNVERIFIED_CONTAM: Retrovirus-related Pol polyprotein from transposon TNT 1-94 [Sesamum angustifolium]|uniref:Retrovirus-related Pol polyprotein from transposon TNT 1-94 n=1 Tax=Sesamum angustifolium TaxID=2727405 RepID=A0AAW2LI34_9LAMI
MTTLTYGKEIIKVDEITAALLAHNQQKQNARETSHDDSLYVKANQFVDAWILDSGCSYHITPNREWFTPYRSGNSGSVYLGDDRCCNIISVGDVRIKMYDGTIRTLYDVRHIPDLKKNLISLGTLHKNSFIPKVYFLKQKSEIFAKFKLWKAEVENQTGYKKGAKGYKFWDSVARNMVELEPNLVATENRGSSHPTFGDPVAIESGGSSYPPFSSSTTNELQAYNLARDSQRRTNVKPPSRLGYEDMIFFGLLISGGEPTTFYGAITSQEKKEWMGVMVEEMESSQKNHTRS